MAHAMITVALVSLNYKMHMISWTVLVRILDLPTTTATSLVLSSTNNVCDCVNSRGNPSKCLDVSASIGASKVSQYQQTSSHSSTNTRCADNSSARFKLAVSSRNLQIQILNRKKNRNNNKKRNRRKVTRGCEFVGKASYAQIVKYCRNTKVRQSCKRTCSYAGFEYTDCTF